MNPESTWASKRLAKNEHSFAMRFGSLKYTYVNKPWIIKTNNLTTVPHAGTANVLICDTRTRRESSSGNQITMRRVALMWSSFAWVSAATHFNHSDPLHGGAANHWFHYKCAFFPACCWLSAKRMSAVSILRHVGRHTCEVDGSETL